MKKKFDAVDMVRKIRDKNYILTKGMTVKQKLSFYRKGAEELHKKLAISEHASVYAQTKQNSRI